MLKDYKSKLNLKETEKAIKLIKDHFENDLAKELKLMRVSAPLFVYASSGLNDNLNGIEEPVSFVPKSFHGKIEIVHSLAKWKREALGRYEIPLHEGVYADMNAIRKDEDVDNLHSIYVDQWDYELVINKSERNLDTLFSIVKRIYRIMLAMEERVNSIYPVFSNKLPKEITFVSSEELEEKYPNLTRKQREDEVARLHKAVFIYKIGWNLKDGKPHDGRAPDYDDWKLNGDIVVYNPVLDSAFELSSMGIRVDENSIIEQIKERGRLEMLDSPFTKDIVSCKLPYSLGGGIGQSRLCMFYLEKAHIGEVQASLWGDEENARCKELGITLL